MANKMKMLTLLQEARGYNQITNRRPAPRPSVLYLVKLREQTSQASAPKRRLVISMDARNEAGIPLPIKINHIKPETRGTRLVVR